MAYPGTAVRKGDLRADIVSQVQQRLVNVGCGPITIDGIFGDNTESSVELFQTRRALQADGVIGPLDGVREMPGSPNRGKGHSGLVTRVVSGKIDTIEGNTNQVGSRGGDGVYAQTRAIASITVGFIDYGR